MMNTSFPIVAIALCLLASAAPTAQAAENLRLREGISYTNDLDKGFPIVAEKMDDVELDKEHPSFLFFAASGDLNCNRQSKRVVDLYKKYKNNNVKFIVIDVDNATSDAAKKLIQAHYSGYIPTELVFSKGGKVKWTHTGEVETNTIASQLDKALEN